MFDDHQPIYLQIADRIRHEILAGDLRGDDQVMSTNDYATFHRINPATAAKGLNVLVDAGVLYKRRGIGMFVCPDAREELLDERRGAFLTDRLDPVIQEARLLGIPVDELVGHIRAANPSTSPEEQP